MGRRRQHSGGLALASDQIPGHNHNNIDSGLVTFNAAPGFAPKNNALETERQRNHLLYILFMAAGEESGHRNRNRCNVKPDVSLTTPTCQLH
jgi:hypothetical protein